jgi:hypothetical protein
MKTHKIFSALLFSCIITAAYSQKTKTETFKVSGNCGMCESKIEKAAKSAGASYAEWDKDTKVITVKYNTSSSNLAKIQQGIAEAGYDNAGAKATNESYDKLHNCCKYERTDAVKACCDNEKCSKEGCAGMDCCKDKDCCTKDGSSKMDCCKDGKCTKEGHNGKDCCKKS